MGELLQFKRRPKSVTIVLPPGATPDTIKRLVFEQLYSKEEKDFLRNKPPAPSVLA